MRSSFGGQAAKAHQARCFFGDFIHLAGPSWRGLGQLRSRLPTARRGLPVLAQPGIAIGLNIRRADLFDALDGGFAALQRGADPRRPREPQWAHRGGYAHRDGSRDRSCGQAGLLRAAYCVLLLVSFVGVLRSLSGWITVFGVAIPGHRAVLAIGYGGWASIGPGGVR